MGRRGYPAEFRPRALDPLAAGLNPAEVAHGLAALPPTDAVDPASSGPAEPTAALMALLAGLLGSAATLRRIRERRSPQAGLSS